MLTQYQCRILDDIISGAEIQKDLIDGKYCFTLVKDCGDTETIRRDAFERLRDAGLIKLKHNPSIDVERWG